MMRAVVVGAGILGASAAYHLTREGTDVTILDAGHPGKATLAGAGIVCPWVTDNPDDEWYRLCIAGARYHREVLALLGTEPNADIGYAQVGALVVSENEQQVDALEERLRAHLDEAPEIGAVTHVSAERAKAMFPPLRDGLSGLSIGGAGRVDGRLLSATLLRAAVAAGARFRQDSASLRLDGGRVRCIDGEGNEIAADEVIVTAGAWAPQILKPIAIDHPIHLRRGQITHLALAGIDTRRWPVVLPLNGHYFVPFDDSRVVVGATREEGVGFDYRVTAAGQLEVLNAALSIAPGLADATIIETRIGFRPCAPTERPILGRVPGIEGLILGNGLAATGLTIGPFCGRLLADIAIGRAPDFDLTAFAPERTPRSER